ncbi:hypothetical protein B0H34DRAFT_675283 [Crassisporium funariophilum]|nr:hypothetical protein B0H34DRAFT_675283 [Crassisporium funariophilum]
MLRPRDHYAKNLQGAQKTAVTSAVNFLALRKWGHLRLPNGQVAQSVYSESQRTAPNKHNTCNVKITFEGEIAFAKVQFYFLVKNDAEGKLDAYALVSIYGPPDADMLEDSYHTLWACAYSGDNNLKVIPVLVIISLVSMQPLPSKVGNPENLWFVVEKLGLDDIEITGYVDKL